ncbi:MAG: enoyl-CoA hydratase/isomerase family protein [Caulobacterales bacterium]|nr:enoyl-CoA hydratase/isomerase family protein [Caulobacterales bacterium]
MTDEQPVLYSEDGHVAVITLNRPNQMNASSRALRAHLSDAMDAADRNHDIRVVVLTGEGKGFSAGADLNENFVDVRGTINEHILKDHKRLIDNICHSDKAYIAAITGPAAGVSMAYALACDLVVMADNAYLYSPFAALSLVPDGGGAWFMLKAFGYQRAFEMITELKRMSAAECLAAGVANQVVPADQLRTVALERAHKLANNTAPLSLKYAKKILRSAHTASRDDVSVLEADFQYVCSVSHDFKEGVSAFLEKRPPKFEGR